jgi:hypothetical protein
MGCVNEPTNDGQGREMMAYSVSCNVSVDDLARGVHGDGSRAVYEAIGHDGLTVNTRERLRCL